MGDGQHLRIFSLKQLHHSISLKLPMAGAVTKQALRFDQKQPGRSSIRPTSITDYIHRINLNPWDHPGKMPHQQHPIWLVNSHEKPLSQYHHVQKTTKVNICRVSNAVTADFQYTYRKEIKKGVGGE